MWLDEAGEKGEKGGRVKEITQFMAHARTAADGAAAPQLEKTLSFVQRNPGNSIGPRKGRPQ